MKKMLIILMFCSLAAAQDKPYRILNSFNAGELSPLLNAREDLSKFQAGCSQMENMIPLPQGAAQKRPGTVYVAESKNNTKIILFPFQFSTEQSYVIEAGNQYMRFFTDNASVDAGSGTETLTALDNITAHWLCNDDAANTTVLDDDGNTHDATASSNTEDISKTGRVGTGCFDLAGADSFEVADHADFTFGDGNTDSAFSVYAWVRFSITENIQAIISKWNPDFNREWLFTIEADGTLQLKLYDDVANKAAYAVTDSAMTEGWRFVAATYDGSDAASGIILYVDAVAVSITDTTESGYDSMNDEDGDLVIGDDDDGNYPLDGRIDEVAVFSDVLTPSEITTLYNDGSYEISTPYLTADLFELKMEQSADVLYITHPDYEPRKLQRYGNEDWELDVLGVQNGPFRDQNTDVAAKIAASGTTGSITLTATGCTPFVSGTTAGHLPSGAEPTSKSQTGALIKFVHPLDTLAYVTKLEDDYSSDQTEETSWTHFGTIYEGTTWYLTTLGTWTGTLEIQRNYTLGAAVGAAGWETVLVVQGTDNRNVSTSGTEELGDADYRAILTASGGDAGEALYIYWRTDATDHVGIVEITAVASTTSATATVLTTIGSTQATHKWSEGAWSNYRGWPRTATFFEDRLTFGGNSAQPDTIWASVTADYENMLEGADDDDALNFTLSSREVNIINWLVGKDKILIGTSGAEWTLSGSSDEPLTPSNVKAEQHSSFGSADLQATQASESILFFQRGSEIMRELAYNWELDSYVAPDMTILNPEVTGDGITDTAFQQIPDPILWCVKENGDMAIFVYERNEMIYSWSQIITDDDFESVAVIHGAAEDQVWVSVKRTIDGSDKRYIEYFSARDWGSSDSDAFFVDSGITDTGGSTTVSGLDHLEGETVIVLGDGVVQTEASAGDFTVSSGNITVASGLTTVQAGLPYTVQMKTMPLSWYGQGTTILGKVKRVNGVAFQYYDSGDFDYGKDADTKYTLSISGIDTDISNLKTFPAGYDKDGQVFVYQQSPEPLTLVAIMVEFLAY